MLKIHISAQMRPCFLSAPRKRHRPLRGVYIPPKAELRGWGPRMQPQPAGTGHTKAPAESEQKQMFKNGVFFTQWQTQVCCSSNQQSNRAQQSRASGSSACLFCSDSPIYCRMTIFSAKVTTDIER